MHAVPGGVQLEVLHAAPASPSQRPPLCFVHGSYHAAWCWAEHFLPYFAARGYDAYALSLRGQARTRRGLAVAAGAAR
jgi:pimeloyl-ACP methyl ester carboxylesterase